MKHVFRGKFYLECVRLDEFIERKEVKEIVELMAREGIVCRRFEAVEPHKLGTRKRIAIYRGVDTERYYCLAIVTRKKSRILRKEAEFFEELRRRLGEKMETKIKRAYLLYDAPFCSKASAWLAERGWRLFALVDSRE